MGGNFVLRAHIWFTPAVHPASTGYRLDGRELRPRLLVLVVDPCDITTANGGRQDRRAGEHHEGADEECDVKAGDQCADTVAVRSRTSASDATAGYERGRATKPDPPRNTGGYDIPLALLCSGALIASVGIAMPAGAQENVTPKLN